MSYDFSSAPCGCEIHTVHGLTEKRFCAEHADAGDGLAVNSIIFDTPDAAVICLDCGWQGLDSQLKAQACPVCDGRCADV